MSTPEVAAPLYLQILLVALGGAIGCLCRFGVQHIGWFDENPYYYTVAINISGCFIIGVLGALLGFWGAKQIWYVFLFTGCLGGYTTYSAFTLDAMLLIQRHLYWRAVYYITVTLVGGIGGCALGYFGLDKLLRVCSQA
ncbi:MAG: CrcB family protein [Bacteroidales bacterium]|nr:CrcB family protein [Bacteroidales bacterium]